MSTYSAFVTPAKFLSIHIILFLIRSREISMFHVQRGPPMTPEIKRAKTEVKSVVPNYDTHYHTFPNQYFTFSLCETQLSTSKSSKITFLS